MYKFKVYDKTTDGVIEREFRNAFPVEGNRNTNEALAASAETSVRQRLPV